jgi:pyrroline-5-carboxylate reductase
MNQAKLLLVGCGVMGGALKQGWERVKAPFEVTVIDLSYSGALATIDAIPENYKPDIIIFAVKPQVLPEILPLYVRFKATGCLFISIAAGISLDTYHKHLGDDEHIIRAMPNLPVTVGQGMAVLVTRSNLSGKHRTLGQSIFESSGKVIWIENEGLMDVVTAVSGSGPAYFFRFIECLAASGIANGLSFEVAMELARQTAIGAGAMLQQTSDTVADLRKRVTSPGGTTAAALNVLDHAHTLSRLTHTAVKAAIQRGQELAK